MGHYDDQYEREAERRAQFQRTRVEEQRKEGRTCHYCGYTQAEHLAPAAICPTSVYKPKVYTD